MKKTLVSALTTALVVGAASTTFAAANPFSDVPADHWAYDAVTQLAQDGVIEGYGDGTFRGDRNITRYEMAQMVAKAMAKSDVSAKTKALIDKLAAEFSDELNNLGVRVAELEKHADKVKWNGELRLTAVSEKGGVNKTDWSKNGRLGRTDRVKTAEGLFRLEPTAEVNDHWNVKARLDASYTFENDNDNQVTLKRAWADGNYGNLNVRIGRFGSIVDNDLVRDDELSGVALTYGKELKGILEVGKWAGDGAYSAGINKRPVVVAVGVTYKQEGEKGFNGSLGYTHVGKELGRNGFDTWYTGRDWDEGANVWAIGLGYRFNKNIAVGGKYAQNSKDVSEKKAATIQVDYKGAEAAYKGTWGAHLAYRHLGRGAALDPTYDGVDRGEKGFELGVDYTILKNVVGQFIYAHTKAIDDNFDNAAGKGNKFWGRVHFYF